MPTSSYDSYQWVSVFPEARQAPSLSPLLSDVTEQLPESNWEIVAIAVPDLETFWTELNEAIYYWKKPYHLDAFLEGRSPRMHPDEKWSFLGYDITNYWMNWFPWACCFLDGPMTEECLHPSLETSYRRMKSLCDKLNNSEGYMNESDAPFFVSGLFSVERRYKNQE